MWPHVKLAQRVVDLCFLTVIIAIAAALYHLAF